MFKRLLLMFSLLLMPIAALAAADLAINASGVWLSVALDKIEVSKTIRIYARVENKSAEDSVADVQFYVNDALLGTRSISVLSHSNGVGYWDWNTPDTEGVATLSARVHNQEGGDTNPENDSVAIFDLPINADNDGDGVYNRLDNCLSVSNTDQQDTDKDKIGDACEPLPPPQPKPVAAPTAPAVAQTPKPTPPAPTTTPTPTPTSATPQPISEPAPESTPTPVETPVVESTVLEESIPPVLAATTNGVVPALNQELIIQIEQISWNMFRFRPSSRLGALDQQYEWDFGDGAISQERVIEHAFAKPGRYSVSLRMLDENGADQTATMVVRVGFFNLANWRLWLIIALLAIIIILSAVTAGMSETIVDEELDEEPVEPSLEPLTDETGELDSLASTGQDMQDLKRDWAILESISAGGLAPVAASVQAPKKTKKKTTKKKPGKKRTIKVKNV